jgi:PAS domain S-box-containing protein
MFKILIVEDTLAIREEVCDILLLEGYQVFQAENGETGFDMALKELPDLILSDILMPKLNGFEMFEKLQKNKKTCGISLIFLSAKGEKEDVRTGMNAGAEDYLVKPVNTEELITVVKRKLEKQFLIKENLEKLVKENEYVLKEAGRMAKIGYWEFDQKTKITSWSKTVHTIYGTDPREGVPSEKILLNCFDEVSKQQFLNARSALAAHGKLYDIELKMTNLKNENRWIQRLGEPLYNHKKEIIGSRGIIRCITNLKKNQEDLKQSNDRYELVTKATNDAVWDWNLVTGKIYRSAVGFDKVYGFDKKRPIDKKANWNAYIHPEDKDRIAKLLEKITASSDQNNFSFEYGFTGPAGDYKYINDRGFIVRDKKGKAIRIIGAASNITKREEIKNELILAKEQAEELAGFKDQFLANMSHEIRTPLNGIIGFTKILLRDKTTKKQRDQLNAIKTSSDILLVVVNDILDLSKIEAGKMILEKTNLKLPNLVNSLLSTFELRIGEKEQTLNTRFDKDIPKWLIGDTVRINQILLNLIGNALKFTAVGGTINVHLNLLHQDKKKVNIEISVSDTGIGIPANKIKNIFDPFTQSSDNTARKYGGSGLGLNIVKQLIDVMHGSITVKSQVGVGSTFTLTIPLMKSEKTKVKTKKIITVKNKLKSSIALKILIVDDISINQFLAQTIVHDFGFKSDIASNGKVAIELLNKNHYDLILMDLQMPEMNGWEATTYIRNKMEPPKSTIPIIALTADVTKKNADKCKDQRMDAYVSKPINEKELLSKILLLVNKETQKDTMKKICDLNYLHSHGPNNPKFVAEMLQLILTQTPLVMSELKKCLADSDWEGLYGNAHKIKPTLDLIGLPKEIRTIAKQIEDYSSEKVHLDSIPSKLALLESTLTQAYNELEKELEKELKKIKT